MPSGIDRFSTFKLDNLPSSVLIRPMFTEDLEQVQSIDQLSFSLPWPASAFRYELLENPHSLLWVAATINLQERILGLVVTWLILDEAHIATIAVHPDYRRHGIGARLLLVALLDALQKGAKMATLEVRAENFGAQELYRRFRFEVVGRRPHYYRDNNEDAILMSVDLNRPIPGSETYREWLESGGWVHY